MEGPFFWILVSFLGAAQVPIYTLEKSTQTTNADIFYQSEGSVRLTRTYDSDNYRSANGKRREGRDDESPRSRNLGAWQKNVFDKVELAPGWPVRC